MEGAGGSRSLDGCKTDKDERGVEVVSMKGNGGFNGCPSSAGLGD